MRKILALIIILLTVASCHTTRTPEQIRLNRQLDSVAHVKANQAILQGYFVVQASSVSTNYGSLLTGIDPDANFLLIQNDKGMFQIAALRTNPGFNGLGGITLEGNIRDLNIEPGMGVNEETYLQCMLIGSDVNASINVTLLKESDQAIVTIYPTLGSGYITLRGKLIPYRNNNIRIHP